MILKAWVKFTEDGNVECICPEDDCKDCVYDEGCGLYVVKFTPVKENTSSKTKQSIDKLNNSVKKLTREVEQIDKLNKKFIK